MKRVIAAKKKSLETGTPKQDEKLFKNLLDLISKEEERERKTSILEELLKNFMKFSEAKDGSKTKFEKNYRQNLSKFYEVCLTQKERLDVINSFATKLKITKEKLELEFYNICASDINAELKDLEVRAKNSQDQSVKNMIEYKRETLQQFVIKLKEIDPDFKFTTREGDKQVSAKIKIANPPQTTTSLFLGFVPHNCSKFIPKEIKDLVKTSVRFGVRLSEEMQSPNTNIFEAFHRVLLEIDKPKPKIK